MVTQNTVISFEQLVRDFDSLFRHRLFRLETLDDYYAENEREPFARFLAGESDDLAWRGPWKKYVREVRASGRTMSRVHIVSEPPTDYIRFEMLRTYPANVEAGEHVGIIGREKAASLPDMDFWLFDDAAVAVLVYDAAGAVERAEWHDRSDEPQFVADCGEDRDRALRLAAPLAQYVAAHNITEERTTA